MHAAPVARRRRGGRGGGRGAGRRAARRRDVRQAGQAHPPLPARLPARRGRLRRGVPGDGLPPLRPRGERCRSSATWPTHDRRRHEPGRHRPRGRGRRASRAGRSRRRRAGSTSCRCRRSSTGRASTGSSSGTCRRTSVRVADPALGNRTLPRSELEEQWSGYAALLAPTPALADAPEVRANFGWLRTIFRPHRGTFIRALVLALVAAGLQMLIPVFSGIVVDDVIADRDYSLLTLVVVRDGRRRDPDDAHARSCSATSSAAAAVKIDARVARLPDEQAAGAADELLQLAADRRHRAAPGRHAAGPRAVRAERRDRADRGHAARRRGRR